MQPVKIDSLNDDIDDDKRPGSPDSSRTMNDDWASLGIARLPVACVNQTTKNATRILRDPFEKKMARFQ